MKQSIYLHRPIVDILRCYGELEDVINRMLQEAAKGKFDLMDKPPCPGREGAARYDIDILEPNYLDLLSLYTPFSPKISIRRLIYWFVENEMYNELGWQQIKNFESKEDKLFRTKVANALSELQKAKRYAPKRAELFLSNICNNIIELQEYLKNGR